MDKEKMTIVFFSGSYDKAVAMLTLASAAAAMGMDVTVFTTFWGLGLLKKKKRFGGKRILGRIMEAFMPSGMDRLPLSYMNMFGLGPAFMKKLMKDAKAPSVKDLFESSVSIGVKFIPCSTSCSIMGVNRDDLAGVTEQDMAGAVTYVKAAKESSINLFI